MTKTERQKLKDEIRDLTIQLESTSADVRRTRVKTQGAWASYLEAAKKSDAAWNIQQNLSCRLKYAMEKLMR